MLRDDVADRPWIRTRAPRARTFFSCEQTRLAENGGVYTEEEFSQYYGQTYIKKWSQAPAFIRMKYDRVEELANSGVPKAVGVVQKAGEESSRASVPKPGHPMSAPTPIGSVRLCRRALEQSLDPYRDELFPSHVMLRVVFNKLQRHLHRRTQIGTIIVGFTCLYFIFVLFGHHANQNQ